MALAQAAKTARLQPLRPAVASLLRQAARTDFRRAFCAPVVQRRDGTAAPINKLRGFIVSATPLASPLGPESWARAAHARALALA